MSKRRGLPNDEDVRQPHLPAGAIPVVIAGIALGACVYGLVKVLKPDATVVFVPLAIIVVILGLIAQRAIRKPAAARSELVLPISGSALEAEVVRVLEKRGIYGARVRDRQITAKGRTSLLTFGSEIRVSWSDAPEPGCSLVAIEACPPSGILVDYGSSRRLVERLRSALEPGQKTAHHGS